MAFLSLILSFLSKKIGDVLQAIFGWSVTALFGKLPQKKQLAVTGALILSLAWPLFVIGLFLPAVAGWALAFLPLKAWVGDLALRIVWTVLAVVAPPIVGLLVHWAAPSTKGSALRSMVSGYPLAVGFFVAFLITAVTVPIVNLVSMLRGWTESHVYVQPRIGMYKDVARELAEAVARAGLLPEIAPPPRRMMLATTALRFFASSAVAPIVAEELLAVNAPGLALTLYPADLLIRGEPKKVARVRSMMTRTDLDADAWVVASPEAQDLQDQLGRLVDVLREHEAMGAKAGNVVRSRLVAIWHEAIKTDLPYEEWVMLEAIARRVERRLLEQHGGEPMPLDAEDDALGEIAAKANEIPGVKKVEKTMSMTNVNQPPPERLALEEASTGDLIREALDEAKELVKIEIALAKTEVEQEIQQAKRAAIGFGIAAGAAMVALSVLAVALVLALGGTALMALLVGGMLAVVAGVSGFLAYTMLPLKPLERTRRRLKTDLNQLKEHVA